MLLSAGSISRHTNQPIHTAVLDNLQSVYRSEGKYMMAEWSPRQHSIACNKKLILNLLRQMKTLPFIHRELTESGHLMPMGLRTFQRFAAELRVESRDAPGELLSSSSENRQDSLTGTNELMRKSNEEDSTPAQSVTDLPKVSSTVSSHNNNKRSNEPPAGTNKKVSAADRPVQPRREPPPPVTKIKSFELIDVFSEEYPDES